MKTTLNKCLIYFVAILLFSCKDEPNSTQTDFKENLEVQKKGSPAATSKTKDTSTRTTKAIDSSDCIFISEEEYSFCFGKKVVCSDDESFKGMQLRQRINNNLDDTSMQISIGCGPMIDTLSLKPECYLVNLWFGSSGMQCWVYKLNENEKFEGKEYGYHGERTLQKTNGIHDFVLRSYHDNTKEGTLMSFTDKGFDTVAIRGISLMEYNLSKLRKCTSCLNFKKVEKKIEGFEDLKFVFMTDRFSNNMLEYDYTYNMSENYNLSSTNFWRGFIKSINAKDTTYKFIGFFPAIPKQYHLSNATTEYPVFTTGSGLERRLLFYDEKNYTKLLKEVGNHIKRKIPQGNRKIYQSVLFPDDSILTIRTYELPKIGFIEKFNVEMYLDPKYVK